MLEIKQANNIIQFCLFAVKTRKEAKQMACIDSISAMEDRLKELKGIIEDQWDRKGEYAAIISQQSDGYFPQASSHEQDLSTISLCGPVSSVSTDSRSESPA
ncbi:hypothetical protein ACH5RR_008841 [Cinchona calisaya]|uniref:Uncharacterized protein n=1 Tax=Cinchona calisaya TaxID=153742 RepID=A0ABD3AE97_9GENT